MLARYNFHCWYYVVGGYLHTLAIALNGNLHLQLFIRVPHQLPDHTVAFHLQADFLRGAAFRLAPVSESKPLPSITYRVGGMVA
jgi:hypothetical protein